MPSGRPGSAYEPGEDIARRLRQWRRMAGAGVPVDEIAAAMGISRDTLDRSVLRARRAGHPDAVYHPMACLTGEGLSYLVHAAGRRRRKIRAARPARADGTLHEAPAENQRRATNR